MGRAAIDFSRGILPAMPVAPISQVISLGIAVSSRRGPTPHSLLSKIKNLSILISFAALLLICIRSAWPQESSPQFQDLAARAAAARDKDDVPLAIQLYRQADQLKPDWAEGWFYLGLLEYSSNDFPSAIDALNHLLLLQPGAPPALALRGLSEFETAAYDDSLRDLDQAVQKGAANEPHNEQIIRYHYAQLLARAGRFQDAVLQYQFFASHNIDDPDLLLGLGLAGMRNATFPKDISADDRQVFEAAGSAGYTFLSGDSVAADAAFKQLFARYPTTPNLHFFYGVLLFMHGPDLAIDQFRSEVAVAPGNADAHAILAYALMFAGRFAEARPEAELALAGAPGMEMAQLALGRSLAETGDTKSAGEVLNEILKRDPDNLEAHMALAAMYSRAGRKEDAYRERMLCLGLKK
jgi:Flp pilus assembly protein TadD